MPVITYEGPELDESQRRMFIEKLTDAACEVMPMVPRTAFYIYLREHPDSKIGVGGKVLPEYLEWIHAQKARNQDDK